MTVTKASMWPPPQDPTLISVSAQPGVSLSSAHCSYSCHPRAEPRWEDSVCILIICVAQGMSCLQMCVQCLQAPHC